MVNVQHAQQSVTHSNRDRSHPNGSSRLGHCVFKPAGSLNEHVLELVSRSTTMEKCEHSASSQGLSSEDTERRQVQV